MHWRTHAHTHAHTHTRTHTHVHTRAHTHTTHTHAIAIAITPKQHASYHTHAAEVAGAVTVASISILEFVGGEGGHIQAPRA